MIIIMIIIMIMMILKIDKLIQNIPFFLVAVNSNPIIITEQIVKYILSLVSNFSIYIIL